jgi:catechol 2,3-dioxygenase-like lactoylglutathione lyase family enzyme
MPLGNPMGDDTQFDDRGKLESVRAVMVPVRDLALAVEFYTDTLDLALVRNDPQNGSAELATVEGGCRILLLQKKNGGSVDTGVVFLTRSVFDLHRKLVDREVRFVVKPTKVNGLGVLVEFLDLDGNHVRALEETA